MNLESKPVRLSRSRRRRVPWARVLKLVLAILLVAPIIAHSIWAHMARRQLDDWVSAHRREGGATRPQDLDSVFVPDGQNAALDLRAAAAMVSSRTDAALHWSCAPGVLPL